MRIWIFSFTLLIFVLIESIFTSLPISLLLLIPIFVLEKKSWVYVAAFLAGLAIDIFNIRFLGSTSLFFVIFLLIINLYRRKFEISNIFFVLFSSFIGSFFYLIIFGFRLVLPQAFVSAFLGSLFFFLITLLLKRFSLDYKYRISE